jgi:hypothetical protein
MSRKELSYQVDVVAVGADPLVWAVWCEICDCQLGESGIDTKEQRRFMKDHIDLHVAFEKVHGEKK